MPRAIPDIDGNGVVALGKEEFVLPKHLEMGTPDESVQDQWIQSDTKFVGVLFHYGKKGRMP